MFPLGRVVALLQRGFLSFIEAEKRKRREKFQAAVFFSFSQIYYYYFIDSPWDIATKLFLIGFQSCSVITLIAPPVHVTHHQCPSFPPTTTDPSQSFSWLVFSFLLFFWLHVQLYQCDWEFPEFVHMFSNGPRGKNSFLPPAVCNIQPKKRSTQEVQQCPVWSGYISAVLGGDVA